MRARFDPAMARRIGAHVTIVHAAEALDIAAAAADLGQPIRLRLGGVRCWSRPEDGIYLEVDDVEGDIARLRDKLGVGDPPGNYEPHVTLVHPRTGAANEPAAWEVLEHWRLDHMVTVERASVIELVDDLWRVVPEAHAELRMAGTAFVWIAVEPAVAYAAVTDLTRMGEWSPENEGGEWVDGVACVGATFRGHNGDTNEHWETIATVIEAAASERFAFRVGSAGQPGTEWSYRFRADRGGTAVTERFDWRWNPSPEGFRGRVGTMPIEQAADVVAHKQLHLQHQIERTLAALKQKLESDAGAASG